MCFSACGWLRGELIYPEGLDHDMIMAYIRGLELFEEETLSDICEIGVKKGAYNRWVRCLQNVQKAKKPKGERIVAILYLCAIGAEQISKTNPKSSGLRSIIGYCLKVLDAEHKRYMSPLQIHLLYKMIHESIPYPSMPTRTRSYQNLRIHFHTRHHKSRWGTGRIEIQKADK